MKRSIVGNGNIVYMRAEFIDRVVRESIQRLKSDNEKGLEFLRKVPSTRSRIFVSFWLKKAGSAALAEYLDSMPIPRLGYNDVKVAPKGLVEYADNAIRRWEFLSVPMRQTLGMIFVKRGRISAHLREGATDADLRTYGNLKWQWPTERQIIRALSDKFEVQLLHRESGTGAEYSISVKHGVNSCETRILVDIKHKSLAYCHLVNDTQGHFTLIDHSGGWSMNSWNLVTEDNLDESAGLLRKIVNDFESSFD